MGARRLLPGPVGPGTTFTVLAAAAEAARAGRSALIICPTRPAADHARNELARRTGRCDPRTVTTFHGLARSILGMRAPRVAHGRERDAALFDALRAAPPSPERDLALRFRGVRDGLLRVFEELEAAALPTEQLRAALIRARLDEPRADRLSGTFRAWREALAARRLSTDADLLREASGALARGRSAVQPPSLLLVDGFTDLTARQLDLLEALCLRVDEALVPWPVAPDGAPTAAFAGPDRVRARLRAAGFVEEPRPPLGPPFRATSAGDDDPRPPVLRRLATHLFAPGIADAPVSDAPIPDAPISNAPISDAPISDAQGLTIVRAASRRDEALVALTRAREFVAAEPGRRWTDVLVVVPDARRWRRDLERAGQALRVPVRVRGPEPLAQAPLVRGALALLRAAATWDGPALLVAAACPALGLDLDAADALARTARKRGLPALASAAAFEALAAELRGPARVGACAEPSDVKPVRGSGAAAVFVARVVALGKALATTLARDPTTRAAAVARAALRRLLVGVAQADLGERPDPTLALEAASEVAARDALLELLEELERLALPLCDPVEATPTAASEPEALPLPIADRAPTPPSPGGLVGALPALGTTAGGGRRSIDRLAALADSIDRVSRVEGVAPGPDAAALAARLVARLEEEARVSDFTTHDRRRHVLHCVDLAEARAWEADLVLVLGLAEGELPRPAKDDLHLPEGNRRLLAGRRGPGRPPAALRTARDRAEMETFLFYAAVTRARRELWLIGSGFSASGASRPLSRFVDEVRSHLTPAAWSAALVLRSPADLVEDDPARLMTLDALRRFTWRRVAVVSRPTGPEAAKARLATALLGRLLERPTERERAAVALRRLDPRLLRSPLGARALEREYSASELETWATCPFRHFVKYLLRADPEEDLALRGLDALRQGNVVHAALEQVYKTAAPVEAAFAAAFSSEARDLEVGLEEDAFRRQALSAVRTFVDEDDPYLRRMTGLTPTSFEEPFGRAAGKPLEIEAPALGGAIRLRGTIDRIDLLPEVAPTEAVLVPPRRAAFVTDYKLGGREVDPAYLDGMHQGEKLQLPIYLLALDRVFGLDPAGASFAALGTRRRTGVVDPAIGAGWGRAGVDEDRRVRLHRLPVKPTLRRAEEHVRRIVAGIAAGVVEPAPSEAAECERCQVKDVCRLEPWEARRRARRGRALVTLTPPAQIAPIALAAMVPVGDPRATQEVP